MRFIRRLLLLLVILVLLLSGVAFVLPDHAAASRSIVIDRPASLIYPVVDGYRRFNEWSPWFGLDPATKYVWEGPARGVGAKFSWESQNRDVGSGSQTIAAVAPNQRVDTHLDFGDMGTAEAYMILTPEGAGTKVTWGFNSTLPLNFDGKFLFGVMGRYFGLAMDKMVGTDYERGLANLKKLVETFPNTDIAGLEATAKDVSAQPIYFVSTEAPMDAASSTQVLTGAYDEIQAFVQANGIRQADAPFTLIHSHTADKWVFDAGIPVDRNDVAPTGNIKPGTTTAGKVVDFKHVGSYDKLVDTHEKAHAWLAAYGMKETGERSELYVSDPTTTPADQVITTVRVPVQ